MSESFTFCKLEAQQLAVILLEITNITTSDLSGVFILMDFEEISNSVKQFANHPSLIATRRADYTLVFSLMYE